MLTQYKPPPHLYDDSASTRQSLKDVAPCKTIEDLLQLIFAREDPSFTRRFYQYNTPEKIVEKLIHLSKDTQLKRFASREYGENLELDALFRLKKINPKFAPLIVSPGIVHYLDGFEKFFTNYPKLKKLEPMKAYRHFKKLLGNTTAYRATYIQAGHIKNILKDGLFPRPYYKSWNTTENIQASLQLGISNDVANQLVGAPSFTLSLSNYPDLALSLASTKRHLNENKVLYLVEVAVPKLKLFSYGNKIPIPGPHENTTGSWNYLKKNKYTIPIRYKNSTIYYNISPEAESFMVGGIQPDQIRKIWFAPSDIDAPIVDVEWDKSPANMEYASIKRKELMNSLKELSPHLILNTH